MRILPIILLLAVTVSAYPHRRSPLNGLKLQQQTNHRLQAERARKNQERTVIQEDGRSQSGSDIAEKAAAEAKAAQEAQNTAGAHAAHMVKTRLAEKALNAAKAAEVALAGKQAVVEQLEQEMKEAVAVVAENIAAVHQQQATANNAARAAQQAAATHKLMYQVIQHAVELEKTANGVLEMSKTGLQEKIHNLAECRSRVAQLQRKLQSATAERDATKRAAHSAFEAARAACGNARKKKHVTPTEKATTSLYMIE